MTTHDLLLGIDVGTSSAKGAILDESGQTIAQAGSAPYGMRHPRPGWAEQDPGDWWDAVCQVIGQLCDPATADRIAAIAISGQGCACTLIDAAGASVRPAMTWMDTRATAESNALALDHGAAILRRNGNAVGVYNVEPKLLWLREHEPDALDRAAFSLTTTAYVTWRLTGEAAMNHADGGILFAYDAVAGDWSHELLRDLGIPERLYPPLSASTTVIGQVTPAVARETGLREGTPVVAGGEDTPAAALSTGVHQAGDAFLSLGTAGVVGVCRTAGGEWNEPRLLSFPHVLEGLAISSGSMSSAGAAVEWMLGEFGPAFTTGANGPKRDYAAFNDAAQQSPSGANGTMFLPYLSGELHPILNGNARGVFFGLSLETSRQDMARAILEGSAFATRHNLSVAESAGATAAHIRATGGPTQSTPWCQAIADITGRPIEVVAGGGAPIGDAFLAGAGVGIFPDPGQTAFENATVTAEYLPREALRSLYDERFGAYLQLYEHLMPDFDRLAQRGEGRA